MQGNKHSPYDSSPHLGPPRPTSAHLPPSFSPDVRPESRFGTRMYDLKADLGRAVSPSPLGQIRFAYCANTECTFGPRKGGPGTRMYDLKADLGRAVSPSPLGQIRFAYCANTECTFGPRKDGLGDATRARSCGCVCGLARVACRPSAKRGAQTHL